MSHCHTWCVQADRETRRYPFPHLIWNRLACSGTFVRDVNRKNTCLFSANHGTNVDVSRFICLHVTRGYMGNSTQPSMNVVGLQVSALRCIGYRVLKRVTVDFVCAAIWKTVYAVYTALSIKFWFWLELWCTANISRASILNLKSTVYMSSTDNCFAQTPQKMPHQYNCVHAS